MTSNFFCGSLLYVSCKINQKVKLVNRKDDAVVFPQDPFLLLTGLLGIFFF